MCSIIRTTLYPDPAPFATEARDKRMRTMHTYMYVLNGAASRPCAGAEARDIRSNRIKPVQIQIQIQSRFVSMKEKEDS